MSIYHAISVFARSRGEAPAPPRDRTDGRSGPWVS